MHTLRIPTKEQYAYLEVEFEGTPDEALKEYRRLTDLVNDVKGAFREVKTFTGEVILYDTENHAYKTLDGKKLISGSAYKKSLEAPFPPEMAGKIAEKYGMTVEDVKEMWRANAFVSTSFGDALHKAMELYKKYHHNQNEKDYYLPKNPTLREAVLAFPELEDSGYSEIMVSDVANLRVGQIDWLKITGEKKGDVEDYKSDADVKKNLKTHFNQLSFYAHILIAKGWEIESVRVWNWDGKNWTRYDNEVLPLTTKA